MGISTGMGRMTMTLMMMTDIKVGQMRLRNRRLPVRDSEFECNDMLKNDTQCSSISV